MKKIFYIILTLAFVQQNQAFADVLEFSLEIKNHKFFPEILEVPANEKFKLIIKNLDKSAEEFESSELNKEKIILGESEASIIIKPLKAGEYRFFGDFHKEAKGKIIAK